MLRYGTLGNSRGSGFDFKRHDQSNPYSYAPLQMKTYNTTHAYLCASFVSITFSNMSLKTFMLACSGRINLLQHQLSA